MLTGTWYIPPLTPRMVLCRQEQRHNVRMERTASVSTPKGLVAIMVVSGNGCSKSRYRQLAALGRYKLLRSLIIFLVSGCIVGCEG